MQTILLIGVLIISALLIKAGLSRVGLPPLVGFLLLGAGLRLMDVGWSIVDNRDLMRLELLAEMGLVVLLFRVGLESNLKGLVDQLRRASVVWVADVAFSASVGFVTAYTLLGMPLISAVIVATAFTATSVGISVAVWQETGALQSRDGEMLIDVAELDDISAVVLMALLFSIIPALRDNPAPSSALLPTIGLQAGGFCIKLLGFGALCLLFSRYAERPILSWFGRWKSATDPMLIITGIGFVFAATAAWLGFSLAIGAFFAGLVFSRDPNAVKMESSFLPVYDFFSPFFFIGIGLRMDAASIWAALPTGLLLAVAAAGAKLIANGLPLLLMYGRSTALVIGLSMMPRAEISMIIMQHGLEQGDWAIGPQTYNAMVVVCFLTCLLSPPAVRRRLSGKTV